MECHVLLQGSKILVRFHSHNLRMQAKFFCYSFRLWHHIARKQTTRTPCVPNSLAKLRVMSSIAAQVDAIPPTFGAVIFEGVAFIVIITPDLLTTTSFASALAVILFIRFTYFQFSNSNFIFVGVFPYLLKFPQLHERSWQLRTKSYI